MRYSIRELYENSKLKKEIPTTSGVYIVRVPNDMSLEIMKEPDGQQFVKGKKLKNISDNVINKLADLKANKADLSIVYYGRAKNLRKRIMQYVYFGYAYKNYANHVGGRSIWYLKNNKDLYFEFYEVEEFEKEETKLIEEYEKKYGWKPLANSVNGTKISD